VAGLRVNPASVADDGGGGVSVTVAVRVAPPYAAVTVTVVDVVTGWVCGGNTTRLSTPAGTVTGEGTGTRVGWLLVTVTAAPPEGAGAVSVTVREIDPPPWRVDGLTETPARETAAGCGVTVRVADRETPA
jgi:hypothetical protein